MQVWSRFVYSRYNPLVISEGHARSNAISRQWHLKTEKERFKLLVSRGINTSLGRLEMECGATIGGKTLNNTFPLS